MLTLYVCSPYVIWRAKSMRPVCGLPGYTILNGTIKKKFTCMKCVLIPSTATFARNVSHSNNNSARKYHKCTTGLHVKYPLFLSDFNQT
jgi:hypothetical protein